MFYSLQDGRVILTRITDSLILLLFGDTTAQFGMLKHKVCCDCLV
jgi:predicted regulator of Ras-like GTPase activity (Roadblock/LC7/MglB family)